MTGSTKTLTVSYGTFSCSLEGFDDPFEAMQSVAEYFRNLAAEDPYFGAEPPQADAQMLHRMAERENQRQAATRADGESEPQVNVADAPDDDKTAAKSTSFKAREELETAKEDAAPEAKGNSVAEGSEEDAAGAMLARPADPDGSFGAAAADAPAKGQQEVSIPAAALAVGAGAASTAKGLAIPAAASAEASIEVAETPRGKRLAQSDLAQENVKPQDAAQDCGAAPDASSPSDEIAKDAAKDDHVELELEDDDGNPSLVRLTRAEFDQMLASGEIEEINRISAMTETPRDTSDAMTDASSRADQTSIIDAQKNVLAVTPGTHVEADDNAKGQDQSDAEAAPEAEQAARPDAAGDQDFDRLIDEANTQLDEPEGNRRRNAIQHLKRAVAATKADGGLRDRTPQEGASIAKFRDDLRQVVRPRRPETATRDSRTGRPTDSHGSGPLVLVSSQRVDQAKDAAHPVPPTRPVKVSSVPTETRSEEVQSFSDFAKRRGAHELPELLEAAAAYATIVEGQDGISRPQLLRRAASVAGEENMTREQGLKTFGQLLRSGRLRKLSAGRFALAEDAENRDSAAS